MINLRSGRITDILPDNLASQLEVQAFGYALHRQIAKLCDMADKVKFLTAIQEAPDEILDYLAIELRTPCYKMEYSTEVKRSLILSTLPYYMKMGTTYMVNSIIQTIFGNGHIVEFFDAGLNPHHFMVHIQGADATSRPTTEFREVLEAVKRKSQWLDAVVLEFDQMEHTTRFGGRMSSTMTTPMEEQPDNIHFEKTERIGGTVGTAMTTPLQEQADQFLFKHSARFGGGLGAITSTPVPNKEDKLEFAGSVNIGGGLNTVQSTPLTEILGG